MIGIPARSPARDSSGLSGDWLAVTPGALYGLIALAASVLIAVAVRRHRTFQTGFDLGIFDQALWNTAHGRLLFSSLKGDTILLGDHFDPLPSSSLFRSIRSFPRR